MKLSEILETILEDKEIFEKRKCKRRKKKLVELNEDNIDGLLEEIDEILDYIKMFEEDELDDSEIEELEEAIECLDDEIVEMLDEASDFEDEDEITETLYLNKTPMSVRAKARKYARSSKGKLARKRYLKKLRKFKQRINACKKRGLRFSLRQMKCVKPKKRR